MATINTLKADNNAIIRAQVAVDSITTDDVADRYDVLADELLTRGIATAPTTSAMSSLSGNNFNKAIVKNNGTFEWLASGTVDGVDIFSASGGGVWSRIATDASAPASVGLDNLSDVVITAPTPGDVLEFNGVEWVNVQKLYEPAATGDFAFALPNDRMLAVINVEVTATLLAFQIGTSPGAGDVVPAQPILLSDQFATFTIFLFTGPGVTLQFEGVTSQIYTKIYLL
jgi:hypothetical protein